MVMVAVVTNAGVGVEVVNGEVAVVVNEWVDFDDENFVVKERFEGREELPGDDVSFEEISSAAKDEDARENRLFDLAVQRRLLPETASKRNDQRDSFVVATFVADAVAA